jgi:hypothetical protein
MFQLGGSVRDANPHVWARLFFGQVDPADASHFTIDFEFAGHTGTIDAYLRDDNRVDFQFRDPPNPNVDGLNVR